MIRQLLIALLFVVPAFGQDLSQVPETRLVPITYVGGAFFQVSSPPPRQSLSRNEDGTFWKFAPEEPAHAAAVRISAGSAGGSGTLVGTNGSITLVVTNHHVVEQDGIHCAPTVDVIMRNGQTLKASFIQATPVEDVAVYYIERTDLPCVAVSSENAPDGVEICVMGFGGPLHHKNAFRPFIAPTVQSTAAISIDAPTISGDSGSGMIWKNVLVGVNWGGPSPTQTAGVSSGEGIPLVYPATSSADAKFLNRFLTQSCGPMGCQPIIGRPGYLIPRGDQQWDRQPREFPGPEQFYRPDNQGQSPPQGQQPYTQPQQPQQSPPTQPQSPACPPCPNCGPSLNKPDGTQPGCECEPCRDGEKGERGEQGPQGEPGKDAELTQEQIDQMIERLANDPRFRGPQGEQGAQGVGLTADAIAALKKDFLESVTHPDIEVVIGQDGKIIDSETYKSGEPIVLDIAALIKAANAK